MSPIITAVVAPLSVTALSSGTGGGTTLVHSSIISAEAHVADVRIPRIAATIAAPHTRFRIFDITSSLGELSSANNSSFICQESIYHIVLGEHPCLGLTRKPQEYTTRSFLPNFDWQSSRKAKYLTPNTSCLKSVNA